MYTSGTTDRPKGVIHSYANYHWKCLDHIAVLGLHGGERLLVVGPLYHVGAFDLPGLAVLQMGGMLAVQREFEPEETLALIARERLTAGWMAPVMLNRLLALPDRERFDVSSFRWQIGGGERTPEERIREFGSLFTSGRYIDGYGLTESCSGDTLMEAGREIEKIGSTGRALPHVEIRICDDDGGALPLRRGRRNLPARPQGHRRLLARPGEDRGQLPPGPLVSHRRHRLPRRRGLSVPHRPQEGHDHQRRREHRQQRGRARAVPAAAGAGSRGGRPARRALGRARGRGVVVLRPGTTPHARRTADLLPRQARRLQAAEGTGAARDPAASTIGQGAQARAACRTDIDKRSAT